VGPTVYRCYQWIICGKSEKEYSGDPREEKVAEARKYMKSYSWTTTNFSGAIPNSSLRKLEDELFLMRGSFVTT
jgi:hypothetical protein